MPNFTHAKPHVYGVPTKLRPEDTSAAVLSFRPEPIPVTWFARLVNALADRDQAGADEARRELRRRGYDVRPLGGVAKRKGVPG